MSKNTFEINNDDGWVQVADGICVVTITDDGSGALMFNTSASDTNAFVDLPENGQQYLQNEDVDTFVKTSGSDSRSWTILVDGAAL